MSTAAAPDRPDRRVTRSRTEKVLFGVCGGLGRYFDVDPVVFRLAFIALTFVGGSGLLLYLVAALIIPRADGQPSVAEAALGGRDRQQTLVGGALVVLALVVLGGSFGSWHGPFWFGPELWVVLALAGGGILWLVSRERAGVPAGGEGGGGPAPAASPPAPEASPPGPEASAPEAEASPQDSEEIRGPGTALATRPPSAVDRVAGGQETEDADVIEAGDSEPGPGAPDDGDLRTAATAVQPPPRRRGPSYALIGLAVLLLGGGILGALSVADVVSIPLVAALAAGVVALGALTVAASRHGRAGGVLTLGLVLALLTAGVAAADVPFKGGTGERTVRPASVRDVEPAYRLTAGHLELDLRSVRFPAGVTNIDTSVAAGELIVRVPEGVAVDVDAETRAGEIEIFGLRASDGWGAKARRVDPGYARAPVRLDLDALVGFGRIEVLRAAG